MRHTIGGIPGSRGASAILAVVAAASCSGDADRTDASRSLEWTAVVDTVADTVRVRTTAGQVWPSDGHLVSEFSIGVLDGAPEYQFGNLRALAVGADERIYVLDGHGPVVRMYAADGTYMQDIGHEGEGPGEYKRPDSGLVVLSDGRLALRDPGNGRISLYDAEGTYLDSWPVAGSMNTSNPMIATTAGEALTPIIKNLGSSVTEWKRGMARYRPDGTIDTLDVPDLGYEGPYVSGETEGNSSQTSVPFTARQKTTFSPLGYFVAGLNSEYKFKLLRHDGPVIEISRDYDPVPVLADEAEIGRARITKNFRNQFPGWKWNGPPIPDVKPAYADLFASEGGRIWVRLHVPSERVLTPDEQRAEEERQELPVNPYREPAVFDVFEPTGEYLGRVETVTGFQTYPSPVFRDRTVWAVVTDDLDVARLHRFTVAFDTPGNELASNE